MSSETQPEVTTTSELTKGVIYLAVGEKYLKEAVKSARSIRKFHPKLKISLHTNLYTKALMYQNLFHRIKPVDMEPAREKKYRIAAYAKLNKIKAMSTFPYDLTLYLDCDTQVVKPISELFQLIETGEHDMLIANSPKLDKSQVPFRLVSYQRKNAYNSGVILYRKNERVTTLYGEWLKKCQQDKNAFTYGKGKFYDQPKLVELLNQADSPIKLKVIPNTIYNARHTMIPRLKKDKLWPKVKIIHKH